MTKTIKSTLGMILSSLILVAFVILSDHQSKYYISFFLFLYTLYIIMCENSSLAYKSMYEKLKKEVSCGQETHAQILKYTNFNLQEWIAKNISWESDLEPKFYTHLVNKDLIKYLQW